MGDLVTRMQQLGKVVCVLGRPGGSDDGEDAYVEGIEWVESKCTRRREDRRVSDWCLTLSLPVQFPQGDEYSRVAKGETDDPVAFRVKLMSARVGRGWGEGEWGRREREGGGGGGEG